MLFSDFTLRVEPGELIWVNGPNGSGKSSLLRMMAGLGIPMSGRIDRDYSNLGYLDHKPGLRPTLKSKVEMALWDIERSAPFVRGISGLGDKRVSALSAGQKQRIALSRLPLTPGALWLLDEPYAPLDADTCDLLDGHLKRLAHIGGAAIVASHTQREGIFGRALDLVMS